MDHLTLYLPWAIAAALYIEHGWTWLRLVMVTDTSTRSAALLEDMSGKNGSAAAAAAKLVALCVIVGWPAFMVYGWISARCTHG
jgi:hypothetical protein